MVFGTFEAADKYTNFPEMFPIFIVRINVLSRIISDVGRPDRIGKVVLPDPAPLDQILPEAVAARLPPAGSPWMLSVIQHSR